MQNNQERAKLPFIIALLTLTIGFFSINFSSYAQTIAVDGWSVTYQGRSVSAGNTTFSYRACPSASGAGNLSSFTLGVPSCLPPFEIVSTSPSTSVSIRRDDSNGVLGILWTSLSGTSCRNFSYTLRGDVTVGDINNNPINIGLTDTDSCGGCCTTCGDGGKLPGPICTVKGVGICGQISRGDVSFMFDQNACISKNGAASQRAAAIQFAVNQGALRVRSQIAIGSYNYGNTSQCDTTGWASGYVVPEFKSYARYLSLLNGTLTQPVTGLDYDGFLQPEYGVYGTNEDNSTKTYRALYGFSNQSPFTCGTSSMAAALQVSGRHLTSNWGDPQTPNYVILISNGRPNQLTNGGACTGSTAGNSPCHCTAARDAAKTQRDSLIAQGVRVFAIFFDDNSNAANCNCTQTYINSGKTFLRDQIASPNSYFEANSTTLSSVVNSINGLMQQFVYCDQNQFPGSCGVKCNPSNNGGTCEPISCPPPPTVTPDPIDSCTPVNVNGAISATDIAADILHQKTVSATRVLEKIKGKTHKATKAFNTKARTDSKRAYTKTWTQIFGLIPSIVYLCPSGCVSQTTLVGSKSVVFSSINSQLAVFTRVSKQIRKSTKKATHLKTIKRLEKEAKDTYTNMRRLLNDVPDGSFGKNC